MRVINYLHGSLLFWLWLSFWPKTMEKKEDCILEKKNSFPNKTISQCSLCKKSKRMDAFQGLPSQIWLSRTHTQNTVDPLTCKAIYIRVSLTIPNHCLFLCMEIDIAMEMEGRCIIIASLWLKSILGFMSKSATYFYSHLESGGHFNWWNLFLWLDIIHIGHCLIHL